MKTYKSLDQLVIGLIEKYANTTLPGATTSSTYYNASQPFSSSKSVTPDETTQIVTELVTSLNQLVVPYIDWGFEITASNPPDNYINVSSGAGVVAGHHLENVESMRLSVPFDGQTPVFYVNFDGLKVSVDPSKYDDKLRLGRIIVPVPGVTVNIQDDKPDTGHDGWIVSGRDAFFDEDTVLDDDSIAVLRDSIGKILADNLIGNVRLSEDLKITNTQGTLELDSKELRLLSTSKNIVAKLNRYGSFFYDDGGALVAKFGTSEARVGNISITGNSIQSTNFISEHSGFQIKDTGYAEFENVRVRGRLSSSVFEYDKVSAVGGKLVVSNSSVLATDINDASTTITVDDPVFAENEVLRMKDGNNDEYFMITNISSAPTYNINRDLANTYSGSGLSYPSWNKGTAVVSYGKVSSLTTTGSTTGFISLDASSAYSPFIDVYKRDSAMYNDYNIRARIGTLEGIYDSAFGGYLTGSGIYTNNAYLKGGLYSVGSGVGSGSGAYRRVNIQNGCIQANEAKFDNPLCSCCYSYIDAGMLRFNDELGSVPYVKRIASGTADTGCVVELNGWKVAPNVIVSVKSLCSYAAAQSAQNQRWNVYNDTPECYVTSATCYGYCFVIHALLELASGASNEIAKNIAMDACATTEACTCASCFRFNFQYWCNGAAPDCYCYGTLCYAICYKTSTADPDVWEGACCYEYVQPHSSVGEIKSTSNTYAAMTFPCMATWVVMAHQVSLTYTNSGVCSSTFTCCCVTCNASSCNLGMMCLGGYDEGCCTQSGTITFGASPSGTIYCTCLYYSVSVCKSQSGWAYPNGVCTISRITAPGMSIICNMVNGQTQSTTRVDCNMIVGNTSYCCSFAFAEMICRGYNMMNYDYYDNNMNCIYGICQIVCYCAASGAADSCASSNLCSVVNCYGCYCALDPSGTLNWLAIAYT